MNVLHISFARTWRGGENQVLLLIDHLKKLNVISFCAFTANSELSNRTEENFLFKLFRQPLFTLIQWPHLLRFIDRNKILILHCHCAKAHSLGIFIKLLRPNLKLIVHRRVAFTKKKNFFSKFKYKNKYINYYIAISNVVKQTLIELGVSESIIFVIPSAVEIEKYQNKKQDGKQFLRALTTEIDPKTDTLFVGTASALTFEKGIEDFLVALSYLKTKNIVVTIAGEGILRKHLEEKAKTLKLQFPVIFIGFCNKIPLYLSGLDILVMPSHNEGLGSVALESMAASTCVVSSDAGGLKEVVIDQKTGLSFPTNNIELMTSQIELALQNASLREELCANALSFVKESFSAPSMAASCLKLYKNSITLS